MKKILAMVALIAAMIFTGCSNKDDLNDLNDLIGSWENVGSFSKGEDKIVLTFSRDGVLTVEYYCFEYDSSGNLTESEYEIDEFTYTYSDGVLKYKYPDNDETATVTAVISGDYLYITFEDNYTEQYTRVK